MKQALLRAVGSDHIPIEHLAALLESFTLKHAAKQLVKLLDTAESQELSLRQFLL